MKDKIVNELQAIIIAVEDAKKYGLQAEVIWSALYYLKHHPDQSIEDAMATGFNEWIK